MSPEPTELAVRAELDLLLKSDAFTGAARQQRLLKHLVEKRLAGAVNELKEYTLGVEVFDRGEDFDSRLDPIVRVEASRLRSRLQKYYEGAGIDHPIRISLPRGAYLPSFTVKQAVPPPVETPVTPLAVEPVAAVVESAPVTASEPEPANSSSSGMPLPGKIGLAISAVVLVTVIFLTIRNPTPQASAPDFLRFRRLTSDVVPCTSPTFAPDGETVAYARRDGAHWQLYSRDINSLQIRLLTPGSTSDNMQPAWRPQGDQIAFRSDRDGGGIYLLNVQTLKVAPLTHEGYHPAWSPDGKTIAFSTGTFREPGETYSAFSSGIRLVDVATRKVSPLTADRQNSDAVQPAWSPDGKRIAYWASSDGERDIWTIEVRTTGEPGPNPVRVTHDAWTDWSPTWSPDGNYLYFSSDRGGAMNIWRVRIDEKTGNTLSRPEPITTPSSYSGWMSFAANGKQFAYVHRLVSSQLYRAPFTIPNGIAVNQREQLTAGERIVREPDASPDGKWIVARVEDPQEDLVLIHPDGTDLHRITNDNAADRSPHWSPDGREIVFLSNRSDNVGFELWSIHPDGTHLRQLTTHGAVSFAWAPDGSLLGYPGRGKPYNLDDPGAPVKDWGLPDVFRPIAWSPDGKSVVGRMHSNAFGMGALFVLTPGSSDFWQIATAAPYTSVAWLPDGQHLLFSRSDGVYLADLVKHTLTPQPIDVTGQVHSRFTMSRDGSTVFFVISNDEEDIWLGSE